MTRKLFFGATFAAIAVAALLLVQLGQPAKPAEAVINGLSSNILVNVPLSDTSGTITIDADDGLGNVRILTVGGSTTRVLGAATSGNSNDLTLMDTAPVLTVGTGAVSTPSVPCTDCLFGVGFSGGVASLLAAGTVDDDNNGTAGPAVNDVSIMGDQGDVLASGFIDIDEDGDVTSETFSFASGYASGNLDTLQVTFVASALTPGTNTISVIQGASTKTINIVVRGAVDSITIVSQSGVPATAAGTCVGAFASRLALASTTTVTGGATVANFCGIVKDSGGNVVPSQPVIFTTTTNGTLNVATVNTNASGLYGDTAGSGAAGPVNLTTNSSSTAGTKATVTASAGAKSVTVDIAFAGNNASCTLEASPSTLTVGGASVITAKFVDSLGNPVADGQTAGPVGGVASFNLTTPGASATNATLIGTSTSTSGGLGTMKQTLIASIAGAYAVTANISTVNCTTAITVAPAAAATPAPSAAATLSSAVSATGFTLASVSAEAAPASVKTLMACAAGAAPAMWGTSSGAFLTYIFDTAVAAVNAAFQASFTTGDKIKAGAYVFSCNR